MSTPRFMAHICKGPGRLTLAIFVGALLALQCLLPSAAFARSSGQSMAFSSTTQQNYLRDKVGVSVVRLVADYGEGTGANGHVTCTGLGILVASVSKGSTYQNWVLTDGNLVAPKISKCGFSGGSLFINTLQIWANNEYANANQGFLLGQLTCVTQQNMLTCNDKNGTPLTTLESVTTTSSLGQSSYTLLSFQSNVGEPYLTPNFTFTASPNASSEEIGLTNGSTSQPGQVFPSATVSGVELPQNYLRPGIITPPLNPGGASQADAFEGGTPIVDTTGRLVGMFVNTGLGGSAPLPTPMQAIWGKGSLPGLAPVVSSPQACSNVAQTAACWNAGIDAFYGAPSLRSPQYALASSYFGPMIATHKNALFQAPVYFNGLAAQNSASHGRTPTSTSPAPASSPTTSWLLLFGLVSLLVVLVLLLILVTLLGRARRRRRRELDRFAAEQLEARRIAEAEVQRQRTQQSQPLAHTQPQSPVPDAACPNCHKPVRLSDSMCPYCRFPLSPTASGMGVRLMGNAPLPPAPAASISEQPTIQFPPAPNGDGSERTAKRQQPAQEATVYNLQQVRGRNLSLAVGTRSDPGLKRKHKPNEDSLFAMQGARTHNSQPQQFGLFVVADGMGGHANGQDASRLAIQTMIDFMLPRVTGSEPMDDEAFLKLMGDGVQSANQAVHMRNLESHADMGTTMTSALVVASTAYVANVGDSRTYLYREGKGLSKVTNDHSVVASLVEAGIIQPDDIYTHPKRNQIYRSLGEKPVVEVDTFKVDLQPGDKLLLCSDGLWDMTRDPLIQKIMSKPTNDPNRTGQELIKAALEGGGEDNVSVIVAQFSEMNERTGLTGVQLLAKPETVTVPNLPPM